VGRYLEVHVHCQLEELVRRDVKGLYRRALAGEISNFTGVSDPYEEPENPDVRVETDRQSVDEALVAVVDAVNRALAEEYVAEPSLAAEARA
jgi:adenylylsulfate kinase